MDKEKHTSALRAAVAASKPISTRKRVQRGRKRARVDDESDHREAVATTKSAPDASAPRPKYIQPSLITGAQLKDYQLEGVEWMVSLDKNGVSGILGRVCNASVVCVLTLHSGRDGTWKGDTLCIHSPLV